ncbi:MAG: hypothetical protein ACTSQE_00040 [Candidatus Heimdallarchaeaceae archaeon]
MSQVNKSNPEVLTETELGPRTEKEVLIDWGKATVKWLWTKFHSPMGIWFFSIWFTSILTMCITNVLRGESFFNGPSYWIGTFLTYGLNTGQDPTTRLIAKPFFNWIFAPMVVITLGVTLFLLPDCGFFRNGAFPREESDFQKSYMFFNSEVWGSELTNPNHPKWTATYLWLVWMPIILGTFIAGLYNFIMFKKIQKRKKIIPSPTKNLLYSLIATTIVGIAMALMTGNIELHFSGIFRSLFIERKTNSFIIYGSQYNLHGQYHPVGLALTMWLINLIPYALVYAIFLFTANLDTLWKNRFAPLKSFIKLIKKEEVVDLLESVDLENLDVIKGQ